MLEWSEGTMVWRDIWDRWENNPASQMEIILLALRQSFKYMLEPMIEWYCEYAPSYGGEV